MITVQFHSITDLITNSSTTIYTYSSESLEACKEMIDEVFNTLGIDKKCDDVFRLTVLAEESYIYDEWKNKLDEDEDEDDFDDDDDDDLNEDEEDEEDGDEDEDEDEDEELSDIDKLINEIVHGRAEKPQWMTDAEEDEDEYGYTPSTKLYIVAKSPEFEALAQKIANFLYSTSQEATG